MSFKIAMYLPATTGILAPPFTPNPYGKVEAPQLGVHPAYKNFAVVSPLVASNSYFHTFNRIYGNHLRISTPTVEVTGNQ